MNNTKKYVMTALYTALIAVGAFIRIPLPLVPFTLQNFFVMLAGIFLGAQFGAISVLLYIILGLIGLPVFSGGGGLIYILNPTFGYIIGFCIAAFAIGKLTEKKTQHSFKSLFLSCLLGVIIIYAFGVLYFWAIRTFYIGNAVTAYTLFISCFLATLPADIIKAALAAELGKRLFRYKLF